MSALCIRSLIIINYACYYILYNIYSIYVKYSKFQTLSISEQITVK